MVKEIIYIDILILAFYTEVNIMIPSLFLHLTDLCFSHKRFYNPVYLIGSVSGNCDVWQKSGLRPRPSHQEEEKGKIFPTFTPGCAAWLQHEPSTLTTDTLTYFQSTVMKIARRTMELNKQFLTKQWHLHYIFQLSCMDKNVSLLSLDIILLLVMLIDLSNNILFSYM